MYPDIHDFTLSNLTFSVCRDATPAAAAETNFILIKNPAGSGVNLSFYRIKCVAISALGAATGVESVIRIYNNPTITSNGTAMTINHQHVGDATPSIMQVFSVPTTSNNGSLQAVYGVSSQGTTTADIITNYSYILSPGNSILFTVQGVVNGPSETAITVIWTEL